MLHACVAPTRGGDGLLVSSFSVWGEFFFSWRNNPLVGQGLLIIEASRSHSDKPHSQDSCERVISSTQNPLPDNTQHPQETDMHTLGFAPAVPASERLQTNPLDRAVLGRVNPMYTRTPSMSPPLEGPRVLFCPRLAASC